VAASSVQSFGNVRIDYRFGGADANRIQAYAASRGCVGIPQADCDANREGKQPCRT
jgi:hypothetical protein